jgi:adenylyltransferase/sulfurtransferase
MVLSARELVRYARHLPLQEVGPEGQERLRAARVLLVGAGGLGSPAALYLAAAGVGCLGLVDDDRVDLTNLQRQVLHGTSSLGRPKTESAAERLRDLNPEIAVETFPTRLQAANALDLVSRFDLVVDGSDNFPTRYLVNDACVLTRRPYVYGSILRFDGQVSVFAAPGGPCYRCLFADPPPPELVPNCAEGGVLGVLPGIIGSLQALEAIKLILGTGTPLIGRLLLFEGLPLRVREIRVQRDPGCAVCGDTPTITAPINYEAFCGVHPRVPTDAEISAAELRDRLRSASPPLVVDVREPWEWEIARIPGSLHVPLGTLAARLRELDSRREVVTVCHRGARSLTARDLLRGAGFANVRSLKGGVDAWAEEVEPGMARY